MSLSDRDCVLIGRVMPGNTSVTHFKDFRCGLDDLAALLDAARAEGVAALQQAGDHVAEVGKLIDLPTGPVAWARSTVIRDRDGYSIGSDEPEVHWGPTYPEDETDWFPLFALSQQPAEQIAENANCSPEPAAEPVAWRILDQFGTALALCALKPTDLIVGETLQPLYASPLPQQTALVEEGVEKIIGPHEPAACGEGTLPSPSGAPRSAGQDDLFPLLASSWFYGGWKAETRNERRMQDIMTREGWWPIESEAALIAKLDACLNCGGDLETGPSGFTDCPACNPDPARCA
ncbi:MAG: hypothetical protein V4820_11940 [Pseudomonadota bacterium]